MGLEPTRSSLKGWSLVPLYYGVNLLAPQDGIEPPTRRLRRRPSLEGRRCQSSALPLSYWGMKCHGWLVTCATDSNRRSPHTQGAVGGHPLCPFGRTDLSLSRGTHPILGALSAYSSSKWLSQARRPMPAGWLNACGAPRSGSSHHHLHWR